MRIHRLEIQAFGPFADRQHIDFDELAAQGLFLLNGPTGAGKSSILDAICYALYGSVPGVRQNAKRLRSDHAPDGLVPEVICEFSVGSRRLEVTRNPSWQRPAKRGTGTTVEQAKTLLRERVAGEWVTRSTRNDEAAAELLGLLGMNRDQFTRVVMLPQGEFAAFLRSDAAARGELLQKLFATDRFSTVEQTLAEHATRAASRLQVVQGEREVLLSRAIDEVQRHHLPGGALPGFAGGVAGADGQAEASEGAAAEPDLAVMQDLLIAAVEEGRRTVKRGRSARDQAVRTRLQLEDERRNRLAYRTLLQEAEANRAALEDADALGKRLELHRRAEILEGPLLALDDAAAKVKVQRKRFSAALADLSGRAGAGSEIPELTGGDQGLTAAVLDSVHQRLRDRLAEARAALPLEEELRNLLLRMKDSERRFGDQAAEAERCLVREQDAEQELQKLASAVQAAVAGAARVGELATQSAATAELLELLAQADAAEEKVQQLDRQHQEDHALFLAAKEDWLSKLQLRLEQAAAELAARLRAGEPCPVCGSAEHPSPTVVEPLALVTLEDEQTARESHDRAERRLRDSADARDAAALSAAGLRARCGAHNRTDLQAVLAGLEQELGEARQAAQDEASLRERERVLLETLAALGLQRSRLERSQAEDSARLATLKDHEAMLVTRLQAVRGNYESVADRVHTLAGLEQGLADACAALARQDQAQEQLADAAAVLQARLAGTAFESADAARAALLDATDVQAAEEAIREAGNTAHRIERDLQRDEHLAAAALEEAGTPIPGEAAIAAALREEAEASEQLQQAVLEVGLLEQSVVQLNSYADRAAILEERIRPLLQDYELAKAVADTARGNGGENLYRMSLATYVLAARLEQVAVAATERLQHMSDGRYSLVHSDSRSGNRKSGLGLNVIDSWTGMRRDTATLSGGESFMASLALALGLADVVQQESGGLDIETLFVDEGFGSLDDQSLEQVMNALENLRDGGRVVGLVSHVAELKQRIPAQLHVTKGRAGSTVRFLDQLERV